MGLNCSGLHWVGREKDRLGIVLFATLFSYFLMAELSNGQNGRPFVGVIDCSFIESCKEINFHFLQRAKNSSVG